MNERLKPLSFTLSSQVDGEGVAGVHVPEKFITTHVSVFGTVSGEAYAATADFVVGAVARISGIDLETDALNELATPATFAKNELIELDANLTEGNFTGNVVLWGHVSE